MRLIIEAQICIGCGLCEQICPHVFQLTDEMVAVVRQSTIAVHEVAAVDDAATACPVQAIRWE